MQPISNNKLSKDDIIHLYLFAMNYESIYKNKTGHFNINDNTLQTFLTNKNIMLGGLNKKDKQKRNKYSNWILYEQRGTGAEGKDKALFLLRHIRNAVCHNRVNKEKKEKLILKDMNKEKETMEGRIAAKLLYELIELIIKTDK